MALIPILFLMASVPAGVVGNVCEGMSFGDCTLEDDIIIEELPVDAETCRMVCLLDDTCVFWRARMDDQLECTIMKSDYHQDCNSFAGPTAGSVEDCYSVDLATCDAIKQDECTYTGERLTDLEPPPGQTSSIQQCQDRARLLGAAHFHFIGVGTEECRLYATVKTKCNVVGAAYQTPEDCQLPVPEESMTLHATCDNVMKVYFDGVLQPADPSMQDYHKSSQLAIPGGTQVLAIECLDTGGEEGILASTEDGGVTDETWSCSRDPVEGWTGPGFQDPDGSFTKATLEGTNGLGPWGVIEGIEGQANWIRPQAEESPPRQAYCRKNI